MVDYKSKIEKGFHYLGISVIRFRLAILLTTVMVAGLAAAQLPKLSIATSAVTQNRETVEYATTGNGNFKLQLNEGKADLSYQAPGYGRLQDSINVVNGKNKTIIKKIQRDSVDGWSSILLLIPGVFGLLIACFKEKANTDKADKTSTYSQMMVALANGVIWAVVLVCIWSQVSLLNGVTKIQLFHSSLSFEFFVPFLGYLGSLLFVFDLFRAKDSDTFKNKEFGMRIIMGP